VAKKIEIWYNMGVENMGVKIIEVVSGIIRCGDRCRARALEHEALGWYTPARDVLPLLLLRRRGTAAGGVRRCFMKEALASSPRTSVLSAGYDFFANFTAVVDRLGGNMTFVKD